IRSHAYDIYVTPAGSSERVVGIGFAFRSEQSAVTVLNNLALYGYVGSETVCNLAFLSWSPPATPDGGSRSPDAGSTGGSGGGGGAVPLQETFEDNAFAGRGWYDGSGGTSMYTTTAQPLSATTRAPA